MEGGAGAIWRWSAADTAETPSIWEPVPQAEATLLEHAYLQAWSRLELTIAGTPYVIDPFSPDAEANIATPVDDLGGPVLLLARIVSAATEQLVERARGKVGLPSAETVAEASSQGGSSVLNSQHHGISSSRELTCTLSGGPPSADSTAASGAEVAVESPLVLLPTSSSKAEACGDSSVVRQILVDGIDVALQHAGKRRLSPAGIAVAMAHFMELSFPVRVGAHL
ncbi:hypothetical protein ACSSS7_003264 [Eimeria intestinalis]